MPPRKTDGALQVLNELTPDETALARRLWRDLTTDVPTAHQRLEVAPLNVRAAIGLALGCLGTKGENPFE